MKVVGLLFTKDLAIVDPKDEIPIKTLVEIHLHVVLRIPANTDLKEALNMLKDGNFFLYVKGS